MSIEKLNALMTEYSQLKGDNGNLARCKMIKSQVATILYSPTLFRMLEGRVKNAIAGFSTIYQPDEFITETFMQYIDKYDHNINNNFYAFFLKYLGYTISNILRRERPERQIYITIEDDGGNTMPDTISDNTASPEILVSIDMLFTEPLSEEEAAVRQKFVEYFSKMIPCVVHSMEHRGYRVKYYRAFASDFYIASCKFGMHLRYKMNENEAFSIMDCGLADFTLTDVCRTFSALKNTPCKTYSAIGVTGRTYAGGEIETPFKNSVYTTYFGVTDGAISQRKHSFYRDIGILVNEDK